MLKKTRLPQSFKSYLCSENITRTCITENKQHVILPYFQFYISLKQVHSSLYPWLYLLELPETDSHLLFMGGTAANFLQKVFGVALKLYLFLNKLLLSPLTGLFQSPLPVFAQMCLAGVSQEQHWKLFALASLVSSNTILMAETVTETIIFLDRRWPSSVTQWMATRTPKFVHLCGRIT